MTGALVVLSIWEIVFQIVMIIRGPTENFNWVYMIIVGITWLFGGPYLIFQIKYALRVKRLMKDVYHKSFSKKEVFSKGNAEDIVARNLKSLLKKEKIFHRTGKTTFYIPEIGKYRYNILAKKKKIRFIIKKNTTIFPGDGSLLLVPETEEREAVEEMKDLIDKAFGVGKVPSKK